MPCYGSIYCRLVPGDVDSNRTVYMATMFPVLYAVVGANESVLSATEMDIAPTQVDGKARFCHVHP